MPEKFTLKGDLRRPIRLAKRSIGWLIFIAFSSLVGFGEAVSPGAGINGVFLKFALLSGFTALLTFRGPGLRKVSLVLGLVSIAIWGASLPFIPEPTPQQQAIYEAKQAANEVKVVESEVDAERVKAEKALRKATPAVITTCERLAKKSLKAPRSAKFAWGDKASNYTYDLETNTATYRNKVDAQNSFGAMIRSDFGCSYDLKSEQVRLLYLE